MNMGLILHCSRIVRAFTACLEIMRLRAICWSAGGGWIMEKARMGSSGSCLYTNLLGLYGGNPCGLSLTILLMGGTAPGVFLRVFR